MKDIINNLIKIDSGDGYYDPEKGTIFTYEGKFLRIPNEDEVDINFICL